MTIPIIAENYLPENLQESFTKKMTDEINDVMK